MLLPAVLGVHGSQRGVDAPGGQGGVGVVAGRLPTASTSTPSSASSMAARSPDPPVPITSTPVEILRSRILPVPPSNRWPVALSLDSLFVVSPLLPATELFIPMASTLETRQPLVQ